MNLQTFPLFIFFSISSGAQGISIKARVFDASTHKPIAYASAQNGHSRVIVDADSAGFFEIKATDGDSILVSCIGYQSKLIYAGKESLDSVFLAGQVVELPSVFVRSNIPTLNLGLVKEKQNRSTIGESGSDRYQMAILIKIPDSVKIYRLSKVRVRQKEFSEDWPVMLHVYTVDSFGLPGIELLRKNTILSKEGHVSGFNEIIVKDQDIILEDTAIFVGVQFLNLPNRIKLSSKLDIGFAETFRFSENITYRRGTMQGGRWHTWYENAMVFPFDGVNPEKKFEFKPGKGLGRPINLIASAEIEVLENK